MKIGTISTCYETNETLGKCFLDWHYLRYNKLFGIENVYSSVCHGCFEETAKLGYPIKSQDKTIETLNDFKDCHIIDDLTVFEEPVTEIKCWNTCLNYVLSKNVDYVILLAADEIWSLKDIENAVKFIQKNEYIDIFHAQFKNLIFDYHTYSLDFIVPRIFPTNKHGGLFRFYQDDLIQFIDKKKNFEVSNLTIPRSLCFPRHESWAGSPEKLKRKAAFGVLRYGMASYIWDEKENKLKFNPEYYSKVKLQPELYHD